jgi:hypothetical protein
LGLKASVEAAVELGRGDEEKENALGRQVEQLDYEAKRAFEQYNEVDPRNRLVATELERRWNEKLKALESARCEYTTLVSSRPVVTEQQREALLTLGERFDAVWNNAACPIELKKRIVRTIVEEVVHPLGVPPTGGRLLTTPLVRAGEVLAAPDLNAARELAAHGLGSLPWEGLALSRGEPAIPTRQAVAR